MSDPTNFYAAVASLIPILVLAGVVEFQGLTREIRNFSQDLSVRMTLIASLVASLTVLTFFAVSILGEVLALRALLYGPPSEETRAWIFVALVVGTGLLVSGTLVPLTVALQLKLGSWVLLVWFVLLSLCLAVATLAVLGKL